MKPRWLHYVLMFGVLVGPLWLAWWWAKRWPWLRFDWELRKEWGFEVWLARRIRMYRIHHWQFTVNLPNSQGELAKCEFTWTARTKATLKETDL